MIRSLFSGVTGLRTHNQRMDVIGNNIANVNTTAFKGSTVTFRDVYYQTRQRASGGDFTQGGVNPMQIGLGVQLGTVSTVMTQSGITFSDSVFDLALEGSGFFQVQDPMGRIFYTRLGRFSLDDFGNLTDPNGNVVLGVSGDPTNSMAGQQRINIRIPDIEDAQASHTATFRASDNNNHDIVIRAGGIGPGGNVALTIIPSDAPFSTMTGSTLNVFMDLSYDFETSAVRALLGLSTDLTAADVSNARPWVDGTATFGDMEYSTEIISLLNDRFNLGLTAGDTITHSHVAMFNQAVIEEVSHLFQEQVREAIRIGGVAVDPALVEIEIDFLSTPAVTAAQNAGNHFQMPGTANALTVASPTANGTNTLTARQAEILTAGGTAATAGAVVTAAHVTAWEAIVTEELENRLFFHIEQPGEFGNRYRIDIVADHSAGFNYPTAIWNNNVLTVRVPNDEVCLVALQEVIDRAAAGRENFMITVTAGAPAGEEGAITALDPADDRFTSIMHPSTVQVDAGEHILDTTGMGTTTRRIGMSGGANSFFEDAFRRLGTLALTGGAFHSEQTADTADIFIDRDGVIYGAHPVHGLLLLGRVDIVEFVNPAGLSQVGTSYFVETLASGPAQVRIPRDEAETQIISGALEMSNVDLSQEFSDMIITQRGFQANSRIITVSDSMLEELVNLKR
ncbi:MAG: flagellar hook-basal body complex protein [Oscillospiraceae bacterium]|nr:flagellar hook-basal body complex protein [Oscillospiraceae bacterium]